MVGGTQVESSFEDVERCDLSNLILFRQCERHSPSEYRDVPLLATAAMALLLTVVVGVWVLNEDPKWAIVVFALGVAAISYITLSRRSLRFNSLIISQEFLIWETRSSLTWNYFRHSFRFRELDLPFKLNRPLIIPIDEVTRWSIEDDGQLGGTGTVAVRVVLWRGIFVLPMFWVSSRDRAVTLLRTIQTAIEHINSGAVSHRSEDGTEALTSAASS